MSTTAPRNNDWSVLPIQQVADQSVGIPNVSDFTLDRMTNKLEDPRDFDAWLQAVETTLKGHNLHNLIESNISRPNRDSADADKWFKILLAMTSWLSNSISPDLLTKVASRGKRVIFADEFMDALPEVV